MQTLYHGLNTNTTIYSQKQASHLFLSLFLKTHTPCIFIPGFAVALLCHNKTSRSRTKRRLERRFRWGRPKPRRSSPPSPTHRSPRFPLGFLSLSDASGSRMNFGSEIRFQGKWIWNICVSHSLPNQFLIEPKRVEWNPTFFSESPTLFSQGTIHHFARQISWGEINTGWFETNKKNNPTRGKRQ